MQHRNLGRSGLGCNNFSGRIDRMATRAVVHAALDRGITFFDTSDTYGEEGASAEYLGAARGLHRNDIVLATKFARPMDREGRLRGASRRTIMAAVEASLRRLGTDHVDLYQQHIADPQAPGSRALSRARSATTCWSANSTTRSCPRSGPMASASSRLRRSPTAS